MSLLTRSPSQKRTPLATGREGVLCSDTVRMIPKQMCMIPVMMWMVWGRTEERDPPGHSWPKALPVCQHRQRMGITVAVSRVPPRSHCHTTSWLHPGCAGTQHSSMSQQRELVLNITPVPAKEDLKQDCPWGYSVPALPPRCPVPSRCRISPPTPWAEPF